MTKDPACCVPTDSVARVAKVMKTQDVGSIPVCERQNSRKLVGIITDRDLALHVVAEGRDANSTNVQDVMTREPFTCHPDEDLQSALNAMQLYQVRRIPIVDRMRSWKSASCFRRKRFSAMRTTREQKDNRMMVSNSVF